REFFGDGSMRQIAPVSPALHLGADRIVVIGTARIRNENPERPRGDLFLSLHHVDVLVLTPSEPLEAIAEKHVSNLPWTIRFLLRSVGAMRRGGANLASYLLFEKGYCRELLALGYQDTIAQRDEVEAFMTGGLSTVPGSYLRTVK